MRDQVAADGDYLPGRELIAIVERATPGATPLNPTLRSAPES